jgi:PAS domain-containing protein
MAENQIMTQHHLLGIVARAVLFGVFCILAEHFLNDITLTPFFSLCFLMWQASRRPAFAVLISAVVLLLFVLFSLRNQSPGNISLRIGSFCVGSSLAFAYARARQQSLQSLATSRAIVQSLPVPVVAADSTGAIVAVSDNLLKLISADFQPVVGHSFPDVFMRNLPPGVAMKRYFDFFQQTSNYPKGLYLELQGSLFLPATFQTTGFGKDRLLLACVMRESVDPS